METQQGMEKNWLRGTALGMLIIWAFGRVISLVFAMVAASRNPDTSFSPLSYAPFFLVWAVIAWLPWKFELVGGIIFTFMGILSMFSPLFMMIGRMPLHIGIGPASTTLIGFAFIASWNKTRKAKPLTVNQ